jgi:hypothetical protein
MPTPEPIETHQLPLVVPPPAGCAKMGLAKINTASRNNIFFVIVLLPE